MITLLIILAFSTIVVYLSFLLKITENEDYSINITVARDKRYILPMCFTSLATAFLVFYTGEQDFAISAIILILISMSIFDLRFKLVPDTLHAILIIFVALDLFSQSINMDMWKEHVITSVVVLIIALAVAVITKGGLGGADVKLFVALALFLGKTDMLLVITLTYLGGAPIILLIYFITRKAEIPLVPYITLATLVTLKFNTQILDWYNNGGLMFFN